MSQTLKIPKSLVDVELRDSRGRELAAAVYLAEAVPSGDRRERLQDLLTSRRFVPLRRPEGFSFIARDHVMWLRLDLMSAIDELDPEAEGGAGSVSAGIELTLDDGTMLRGGIRYLLPRTSRRVGDYLEGLPPFFPLRTPNHLFLVNRDRVVQVVPIDEVTP
jgi:hypothetical protein